MTSISKIKPNLAINQDDLNIQTIQIQDYKTLTPSKNYAKEFGSFTDCVFKFQFKQLQHNKQMMRCEDHNIVDKDIYEKYKQLIVKDKITDLKDMWILGQECGARHGNRTWEQMPTEIETQLQDIQYNASLFYDHCIANGYTQQLIDTTYKMDDRYLGESDIVLIKSDDIVMLDLKNSQYRESLLTQYYTQLQMYSICLLQTKGIRVNSFCIFNSMYGTFYKTDNIRLYRHSLQELLGFNLSKTQQILVEQLKQNKQKYIQYYEDLIYELQFIDFFFVDELKKQYEEKILQLQSM